MKIFNMNSSILGLLCVVFLQTAIDKCEGEQSCPGVSLPHTEATYSTCYTEPNSNRVRCDVQPSLSGGRYPSGTQVQLECSSGYGRGVVFVSACHDGNWEFSGDPLQCEGWCPSLNLPNGKLTYNSTPAFGKYPEYTVASLRCIYGYRRSGPSSKQCLQYDYWHDQKPTECNKIPTCSRVHVWDGQVSFDKPGTLQASGDLLEGTMATFSCNSGYKRSGPEKATCQSNGKWTKRPTCKKIKSGPCFPSAAKVMVENGKSVTMYELQIGDRVQTVSSDGSVAYSEVRAFLQKDPNIATKYLSITTLLNNSLTLSGNHLIYAKSCSTDEFNPIYADQVSLGDNVLIHKNDKLIPVKVIDVSSILMQGAFVPLTTEGNILVDDVLASCYASFHHDLAHIAMTPIQWFPEIIQWIFGDEVGPSAFVKTTKYIGSLILP